jgi:hypothetical protein
VFLLEKTSIIISFFIACADIFAVMPNEYGKKQNRKATAVKRNANGQGAGQGNVLPATYMAGEKKKIRANIKPAIFLALISCLVYGNTLKNGFVFDDFTVITENTFVQKGIKAIPEILSTPYRRGYAATVNDLYRPLSVVMFAIEYQFFGKDATPFHFVNICLFACCVVLLYPLKKSG